MSLTRPILPRRQSGGAEDAGRIEAHYATGSAPPIRGSQSITSTTTLLVVGWVCVGLGGSIHLGDYSAEAVMLVTFGTALIVVAAVAGLTPTRWSRIAGTTAGLGVLGGAVQLAYGDGADAMAIRVLISVAAAVATSWLTLDLPRPIAASYVAVALVTVAGVIMVHAYPRPAIDVWYMLQAATHGLSHGQNIYATKWTSGVPFEMSNGFAYLPAAALLLWPFHVLFGDVRYGLVAVMAGTALLLVHGRSRSSAALLGVLVLLYPQVMFGLADSWVDPLVLGTLCATAYAVTRGRHGWAVVTFALCLACKQQAWLLLPLAFVWKDFGWRRALWSMVGGLLLILPWAISNPHAFYSGAIAYNLHLPPRHDSLSLFSTALSFGWNPGLALTALATLGVMGLVIWRLPRDTFGFLLGAAAVMATFNLTNKQSFYNEWELVAGLVLAAVVMGGTGSAHASPLGDEGAEAALGASPRALSTRPAISS